MRCLAMTGWWRLRSCCRCGSRRRRIRSCRARATATSRRPRVACCRSRPRSATSRPRAVPTCWSASSGSASSTAGSPCRRARRPDTLVLGAGSLRPRSWSGRARAVAGVVIEALDDPPTLSCAPPDPERPSRRSASPKLTFRFERATARHPMWWTRRALPALPPRARGRGPGGRGASRYACEAADPSPPDR